MTDRRSGAGRSGGEDARPAWTTERDEGAGSRDPSGSGLSLSELVGEYRMPAAPGTAPDPRAPTDRIDAERGERDESIGDPEAAKE